MLISLILNTKNNKNKNKNINRTMTNKRMNKNRKAKMGCRIRTIKGLSEFTLNYYTECSNRQLLLQLEDRTINTAAQFKYKNYL